MLASAEQHEVREMGCRNRSRPTVILGKRIIHKDRSEFDSDLDYAMYYLGQMEQYMRACNQSPMTLSTMHAFVKLLSEFLNDAGMTCDPFRVTENEIMHIINNYNVSENSLRSYLSGYRTFLLTVAENRVFDMIKILWNKNGSPNALFIRQEDFLKLWKNADPTELMLLLFGGRCGMRRGEMADIKLSDIKGNVLTIHGKGHGSSGKVRTFPLTENMMEVIKEYIEYRKKMMNSYDGYKGDDLIINIACNHIFQISGQIIHKKIRELGERCGIKLSPHSLRRFYITEMNNNKTAPALIAKSVGHADTNTMMRYVANDLNQLYKELTEQDNQYICL